MIKNCSGDTLKKTLDKMNMAFKALIDKRLKKKKTGKFIENLLGYMKAIEITYNQEGNTYHPHFHVLFMVRPSYFTRGYIKQADWQGIWGDCLGVDYNPIVHVQTVKPKKDIVVNSVEEKNIALQSAICETAKYPIKISDINSVDTVIVFSHALRNRRLVTFGGILAKIKKELNLEDVESGDLVHVENEDKPSTEVTRLLYKWNGRHGAYIC